MLSITFPPESQSDQHASLSTTEGPEFCQSWAMAHDYYRPRTAEDRAKKIAKVQARRKVRINSSAKY